MISKLRGCLSVTTYLKQNIFAFWGNRVKLNKVTFQTLVCTLLFSHSLQAQIFAPLPSENQKTSADLKAYDLGLIKSRNMKHIDQASIDTFFSAFSFDEVQDRSQLIQLAIMPKVTINLLDNLKFKGLGLIGLSTGRVQTRFDNPQFSSMNLNELVLSYSPLKNLDLEFGALNQNDLNTPMLILDRAFPGVQLKNRYEITQNLNVQLKAQYSIPNSVSFEIDRTESEALPSFLTQGFDFNWTPKEWFKIKGDVHHFTYNDLPSVVAFQSGRLGNTAPGIQSAESFFQYDFDGFSQSYQMDFLISKSFVPKISLQVVDNNEAPSSRNRSQWTGIGFDWFFRDVIISPSIAYFFAESDSAPALYSDVRLGRNNREGMSYKLRLNFKNSGFSLSANYIQANLIEPDDVQNDLRTFEFLLELPSVKF